MMTSLANYRPFFSSFCHQLPWAKCLFAQKLGPNLSEMEVRMFDRTKKVIWDQLLASQAEIIKGKLYSEIIGIYQLG